MNEQEQKEMLEEMKKDKDRTYGRKFWAPPSKSEGDFPIRFLPPLKKNSERKFYFTHLIHWIDGTAYECLDQTLVDKNGKEHTAEACRVCQFTKKLFNTSERDTSEWKLASSLGKKVRYIYRIVVRGSEEEATPKFYESGPKIFDNLFHILTETDYGNIVDPKSGRDFIINKTGTGRRSNYDKSMPAANTSPIFGDADQVREVFTKAMEMNYGSLIDFTSPETLDSILRESLGLSTPKAKEEAETESIIDKEDLGEIDMPNEDPEPKKESSSEDEENEQINQILNEFTG